MRHDTVADYAVSEAVFEMLPRVGYKVLLRDYDCHLGKVDIIAKKNGHLCFIGIDKERTELEKVAMYYIKRYGIPDVKYRLIEL